MGLYFYGFNRILSQLITNCDSKNIDTLLSAVRVFASVMCDVDRQFLLVVTTYKGRGSGDRQESEIGLQDATLTVVDFGPTNKLAKSFLEQKQ